MPFVEDKDLIGFWKVVDCVFGDDKFSPNKIVEKERYLKNIIVSPDNSVIVETRTNTDKVSYTKGYIINLCCENTLCKYRFEKINNKTYMIVEWKSGDYQYGKMINCYYVLEKIG